MNKEVMEWATCLRVLRKRGSEGFIFFVSPPVWPGAALANAPRVNLVHIQIYPIK